MPDVRCLTASEAALHFHQLAAVLLDCVAGGASVSFVHPFSMDDAVAFFEKIIEEVDGNQRILIAAFEEDRIVGTVQVITAMPPNQRHRGEVAKLLVHRSARGKGVAEILMRHAEKMAREAGKELLTLDTVVGEAAERLYQRLGWTRSGVIPYYALMPDGKPCDTVFFWKRL